MTIEERFADVLSVYPDIISTTQVQEICGICRTKAYFLKRDGLIPYEKKRDWLTHYHEMRLMDVLAFLYKKELVEDAVRACIRQLYATEIKKYPDVLTTDNVMEITGYGKTSVNNWILHKKLKALKRGKKSFVPRVYLEQFLSSVNYSSIQVKSTKHKGIISTAEALTTQETNYDE